MKDGNGHTSRMKHAMIAAIGLSIFIALAVCPTARAASAKIVFTSPRIPANEGYATDGVNHYLFSSNEIAKYNSDWKPVTANSQPFAGLPFKTYHVPSGVYTVRPNHIGGGAYYDGKLYAPVEHWSSCRYNREQTIAVYNATKPGLPLIRYKNVSANGQEVSAIAIIPAQNELITSSYCDGSKLSVYNLKTLALEGSISLSENIMRIQGLSWNPERREFALTSDNPPEKIGFVYLVSPEGRVHGPVFTTPPWGELEGVDYTQNTIRFLVNHHVYFLKP